MLDFKIMVLGGAYPSSVAVTLDMLSAATALAPRLRLPPPRWKVYSPDGGMVALQGGLHVATAKLPRTSAADRAVWVVPGLGVGQADHLRDRLAMADALQAASTLRRHVTRGGTVAASCSAVFLLHAAGVLVGKQVTTSWWLAPTLQQWAPATRVNADRMVCADGPVVTAGAAMAQTDLMRHLLTAHCGGALVDALARTLLIDGRQAQAPYVVPEALASGSTGHCAIGARQWLVRAHAGAPCAARHGPQPAGLGAQHPPAPRSCSAGNQPHDGGPSGRSRGLPRRHGPAPPDAPNN